MRIKFQITNNSFLFLRTQNVLEDKGIPLDFALFNINLINIIESIQKLNANLLLKEKLLSLRLSFCVGFR